MAKYLIHGTYIGDGLRGLLKEGGSSRRAVVERLAGSVGGTVESYYYAVGEGTAFIILDIPDNVKLSAITLTAEAAGAVTIKTTALISPEELDEAVKLSPIYRAPGQ